MKKFKKYKNIFKIINIISQVWLGKGMELGLGGSGIAS